MPGTPPRRVELIRVSGKGQASRDTPEDQRRALDHLRVVRPCVVIERIDAGAVGLSGALALDERPDLLRLRELSEAGAYDELAVRHLDRLTRHEDPLERALILSMVRKAGATIVEGNGSELDPRTMAGELTWVVRTIASADERLKIRERTVEARRRLAAQGELQGNAPYGRRWDKRTKAWSVVEAEAAVIRDVFESIIRGESLYAIARRFNDAGTPTPRKAKHGWAASHLQSILRQTSMYGEMTTCGLPLKCPPIITKRTYDRAWAAIRSPGRSGRPPGEVARFALIRGVTVCGVCGEPVWVIYSRSRGVVRWYYSCRYRRTARTGDCRRFYRIEKVDVEARAAILEWLARDVAPAAAKKKNTASPKTLEKRLAALEAEETRLLRAARKASSPKAIEDALTEVAGERKELQGQLDDALLAAAMPPSSSVDAERRAVLLRQAQSAGPAKLRALVLQAFSPGAIALLPGGSVEIRATSLRPV